MKGQIYKIISGFYDINFENKIYRVRGSGKLRNQQKHPIVGDFVEFEKNAFVTHIYPRRNGFIRPKVANVDQAAIVVSLQSPNYSSISLNKLLAIIELQDIKPIIIFTKIDLTIQRYSKEYLKDEYEVYEINNLDISTLKNIKNVFKNKLTVFTGLSGVGKSTTIQNITGIARKTQEISKSLGRGKHTTRVVEILTWNHGKMIDTPGFSLLEITFSRQELATSYKDFRANRIYCKFKNCLHDQEQECMIKKMVYDKKISTLRYNDYLKLLKEIANG